MENPRPEKVAVVEEVREKFNSSDAVVFTEYRGLTVGDLFELRSAIRAAGGEYKIYKNTLVRRATHELDLDLDEVLLGPTALAFVTEKPDGTPGDAVLVAKAIKSFAKSNPLLVLKGGRLGDQALDRAGINAFADLAPRDELLAQLAGGLAAPMTNFARLLQALPQNFAYALTALISAGGASKGGASEGGAGSEDTKAEESAEASTDSEASTDTESAKPEAATDAVETTDSEDTDSEDTADAADTAEADTSADEETS